MFRATFGLLVVGTTAFVAPSSVSRTTVMKAFEKAVGAQKPLGFFDPLGLLATADQKRFDRLRYVENKHGRNPQCRKKSR